MKKLAIVLLILLLTIIIGYFLMVRFYYLCSPRYSYQNSFSNKICSLYFLPFKSGYEGRSCLSKDACGRGYCVWDDEEQGGICRDIPVGCVELIGEKGISKKIPTCFD